MAQPQNTEQPQEQFQPELSEEQVKLYTRSYRDTKYRYTPEQLESLRQHSQYYGIPFYEGDFDIWDGIKQAAGGFLEGFTTFKTVEEPDNEYEAIIRNISHLAGFVPGLMTAPLRGLGALSRGLGMVEKAKGLQRAASAIGGLKSVPMWGADKVTKVAKDIIKPIRKAIPDARFDSMSTATKFLTGEGAKHITEGAFHLGVASSISTVWEGVDEMMHSFVGGAMAGGVFRGIGNLIQTGNPIADKWLRGISGSLFMGLPTTQRGATTPEQIYEYLMGAYFGGNEKPWFMARSGKNLKKMQEIAEENVEMRVEMDPELLPGFSKQPKIVRENTIKMAKDAFGDPNYNSTLAHLTLEKMGQLEKIPPDKIRTAGYEIYDKFKKQVEKTRKTGGKIVSLALGDGELGANSFMARVLMDSGIPVINYQQKGKSSRARGETVELGEKVLAKETESVTTANQTFNHDLTKMSDFEWKNMLRTAHQIRKSNAVFVVDRIERDNKSNKLLNMASVTSPKSKWGVQIALDKKKPTYVFDTASNTWHKMDYNPNIRKFVPISEVPKLSTTPAILGGQYISKGGKAAVKELIKNTTGEDFERFSDPVGAKISSLQDRSPKTWEQLKEIVNERVDVVNQLEKTKNKARIKELEAKLEELNNQENVLLNLKANQQMTDEGIVQDIDIGMSPGVSSLTKKSEQFVGKHLEKAWVGTDDPVNKKLEAATFLEDVVAKNTEKGSTEIKSAEVIDIVESKYGELSPTAKGELRSWVRSMQLANPVKFVRFDGNTGQISLTSSVRPRAVSGKSKLVKEPKKEFEEAFEELEMFLGGDYKNKGTTSSLIVFDEVSLPSKQGYTVEVPLDRLVQYYQYTGKMKKEEAQAEYQARLREVITEMFNKHDMMPLGGIGDKPRVLFGKVHPFISSNKAKAKEIFNKVIKEIKKTDKIADVVQSEAAAWRVLVGLKESDTMYEHFFNSNVAYELFLNGYGTNSISQIVKGIKSLANKGHFIRNVVAYNKRSQIWNTVSMKADRTFIEKEMDATGQNDMTNEVIIDITKPATGDNIMKRDNAGFVYSLIKEPALNKLFPSLSKSNPEHVDGAIIVRDDVVDILNRDAGHPVSGQQKSFIVDRMNSVNETLLGETPDNLGTMLGKYMIHKAGPAASAQMKKVGHHMLIYDSAAKQRGLRKSGDYEVKDLTVDGLTIKANNYILDPAAIRYSGSTIQNEHMLEKQIWVKQLFTNLHQFSKEKIDKDVLLDIKKEVIDKGFDGKEEANMMLESYLYDFNPKKIDKVLNNLEDIGTNELVKALTTPGAERFAEKALQRMLKVVEKNIEEDYRDGTIDTYERNQALEELSDYQSPMERLMRNASIIGLEAAEQGKTGYPLFLHQMIAPYKQAVLHNYFVKQVTRPKMENSMVARMRPYDKWMQLEFPELDKNDNIFYLDGAYRGVKIKSTLPGKYKTLGQLWDAYSQDKLTKAQKELAEDVFEAVVLRVPMDSISGAHKLQFKGFTGRDGHGIMLHSKTMRALGGADLDGDEAFVYFGGRTKDGLGGGMKKSWKEAIHRNRNEFIDTKTGEPYDNKTAPLNHPLKKKEKMGTFKDIFTLQSSDDRMKGSYANYFSPFSRLKASIGAVQGRNQLGVAVNSGQTLKAAYNALMETRGKFEIYETERWNFEKQKMEKVTIKRTPRESEEWRAYQRSLTRAQVGFTSDPLDEAGLKDSAFFFNTLHEAYFKTEVLVGRNKWMDTTSQGKEMVSEWTEQNGGLLKKGGLVGNFLNMNSAYFGKNWKAGRRHTMEEVNQLASGITSLTPQQENTLLPMMVRKLYGLDWSDSVLKRVTKETLKREYDEIDDMVVEFNWLQDVMQRKSFRVPFNKIVEKVVESDIQDVTKRREVANSLQKTLEVVVETPWASILKNPKYEKLAKSRQGRFDLLTEMAKTTEQFILQDFIDMTTLKNMKRIFEKYPKIDRNKISTIFRQVELFKARSYLNKREQNLIDVKAYEGSKEEVEAAEKMEFAKNYLKLLQGDITNLEKQLKIPEEERSTTWDQAQLDSKMKDYRASLKEGGEKELFDQFMLGSLRRGEIARLEKLINKIPDSKWTPMMADLKSQLIKEASRTSVSRLGIVSEAIPDSSIRAHLRALNDTFGNVWKKPNQADIELRFKETEKAVKEVTRKDVEDKVEDLAAAALGKELGFKGIRKSEKEIISKEDKEVIEDIVTMLKKYPETVKDGLNEMLAGILSEVTDVAKDLKDFNKQDFKIVREFLRGVEEGTFFQRLWRDKVPTLKRRYSWLFPETINREMMKYDIQWLKKEGFFIDRRTKKPTPKQMLRPTYYIEGLQNWVHEATNQATAAAEAIIVKNAENFINLTSLKENVSEGLFKVAVSQRELGVADYIKKTSTDSKGLDEAWIGNYKQFNKDMEKEYNWKILKDKDFVINNDANEKISATGFEIVNGSKEKNLKGINEKLTEFFKESHAKIRGSKKAFNRYFKDWFNEELQQPYMDWKRFVRDMENTYSKGEKLPMEIGIDGMRHIARSMMYDIAKTPEKKKEIKEWLITNTQSMPFEMYFPHMFFSRKQAEKGLAKAFKHIMEDPRYSDVKDEKTGLSERQREANNLMVRHKVLTGDWNFQEMQDFDRIDQLEIGEALQRIGKKKGETKEDIKWVESNQKFGSMFSRKGHVAGWSADMTVLNAYAKNLTGTYYRQLSQIMSRDTIEKAGKAMYKKMGPELTKKWQTFMKLYVQGAMGNPDVIPEAVYNDPQMKLKGTPFGWWADNRVLDKINKMRKALGLENKNLPEELRKLDFNTIRHWSNLEAKFELASLLAHPKTAITNIFGGQMHTIESVGWKAWNNARDLEYLRKINPEWKSMNDVMQFSIEKGVMPEFLVHELGLGKDTLTKGKIQNFVKDLAGKLTNNKEIAREEITSLGKKHGISDAIINTAALTMSIPERILRRDAYMAHYVRAWQRFGGAIKEYDHPFLIELAKKGVKATQFLYNAPNRPMFARTALGKVMTRFMLFQWNSTRFRNDVYRKAKYYGFTPGTEGFERFKRTMQIDAFVLALSNVFMYSLFDTGLPGPWNFLKDSAEWLFSDEEERDKAFFGMLPGAIAPLQMITPPIARFPIAGISQWVRDDYNKFTDYYMYTLLPFGRFARDVAQPGKGLIDNPIRAVDKLTGLPYLKLAKLSSDSKKDEEPYSTTTRPGFKY